MPIAMPNQRSDTNELLQVGGRTPSAKIRSASTSRCDNIWGHPQQNDFIASYRRQVELGTEIVREQVIPNFLIPLAEAIPPQAS